MARVGSNLNVYWIALSILHEFAKPNKLDLQIYRYTVGSLVALVLLDWLAMHISPVP